MNVKEAAARRALLTREESELRRHQSWPAGCSAHHHNSAPMAITNFDCDSLRQGIIRPVAWPINLDSAAPSFNASDLH